MGPIAARKARVILVNCRRVIAIELCCAAQAVDLSGGPESLAPGTRLVYELVRARVPRLDADRVLARDIAAAEQLLMDQDATERLERQLDEVLV